MSQREKDVVDVQQALALLANVARELYWREDLTNHWRVVRVIDALVVVRNSLEKDEA